MIDLAVIGARGDGKTQFLVHAIRALHGRAPALTGGEQELNRAIMRLVLDPRAPRPDATPPGVVPHFTFRARASTLYDQLGWTGAWRLASKIARVGGLLAFAYLLVVGGIAAMLLYNVQRGVIVAGAGAMLAAIGALLARRRIARAGEIEIVFWDVAGEQVYSSNAADYHALMGRLVDARRQRCEELGRAYAFAPVLICNPLALGMLDEASPYARLRALLPLFAAIDRGAGRALVAINRWSVVDRSARADRAATRSSRSFRRRATRLISRRTRSRASAYAPSASTPRTAATATSASTTSATTQRSTARSRSTTTSASATSTTTVPACSAATRASASSTGSASSRSGRPRDPRGRARARGGRRDTRAARADLGRVGEAGLMRRAWLQKHPSPAARDGAFHWYPAGVDAELRAGFAERLAGVAVPAILWHHAPGRVAWASAFAATAPDDGRNYVGLALVVVEGPGTPADLLARLELPVAAPWTVEPARREPASAPRPAGGIARPRPPRPPEPEPSPLAGIANPAALARALISGGTAVANPASPGLPAAIAALERVMPASVIGRARTGVWVDRGVATATPDRVAELAVAAVASPRSRFAAAWRLLVELGAATGRDVDTLAADAETADTVGPEDGVAPLADNGDWLGTLNAWGRGRLTRDTIELADRVALRAFSHLAADRDPAHVIAEVRWRALLPASRRVELLAVVGRRNPTLRRFVDA